jgi:site-specific recombinase XerD
LAARNIDVVTVMELMGHSDIKMTMRYFHSAPESKIKAVASLEDCIREDHSHFLVTGPVMQQSMRA